MAEGNKDDILVRLDEIEKLQAELRHLVPRVTSSSKHTRHQDLSHDSSASIRFPSLFTFPVISNFTSTSKNESLPQKSAARLNLNSKSLSGNRHSTINLRNAGGSSQRGMRETNVFKNLLRSSNNVSSSHARNSLASTSVADSRTSTRRNIANRVAKDPQEAIKKGLKSEISKATARDKTQRAPNERSNMQLSGNENTSDIRVHGIEVMQLQNPCIRNQYCDRSGMLIKRIMKKLNYCFVDDKKVTVPYHHLGSKTPRRVQLLHSLTIREAETPQ